MGWIIDGILAAINFFFETLVMAALNPLLDLLGRTVLATPGIDDMPRIAEIWDGTRLIVDAGYIVLVLVAGVIVMSHETVQTRHSWKELLPRVAVGFLAANLSLLVAGTAIDLVNALSGAVMGGGVDPAETADALTSMVTGAIGGAGGIFIIFIALVIAVMIVALLVTYVVRVALTVVLIVAAPLALACHALPQTDGVARWWWRAFFGVLAIQLGQSLVLITALRVFFDPGGFGLFGLPTADGLVNLVVTIALLWILIKIPFWIWSSISLGGRSMLGSAVKGLVAYKTLGLVGLGRRRRGNTGHRGRSRSGGARAGSSTVSSAADDPYARSRSDRDGQFLLPFPVTRVPRTSSSPVSPAAGGRGRRRGRGVQLSLPLDNPSALHTPDRVDRHGQYQLPIDVTRIPKPAAAAAAPPVRPRSRGRQPQLPFDPYVPARADRGGQYLLPIDTPRVPRPPQPPPVVTSPAVRRRPPARQPRLPFDTPDPYRGARPTASGQYTLPLGVRRTPKPPTPPPATQPPAAGRGSTGGPRARQLPLPLDPKPPRHPRPPAPPRPSTPPRPAAPAPAPAADTSNSPDRTEPPLREKEAPRPPGSSSSRTRRRRNRPPSSGGTPS